MQYVALASIIRWSVFAAGVLLFIQGPAQLWIVPVIEGSAIICAVSFYLWCFARAFDFRWKRPEYGFALSLLRQAWPIGGAELVWAVKIYFATVWLGIFLEGSEVAWFGAAHRSVIALHTFVWLYFFNLLPALARSTAEPLESLHQLLHTSIQVTAWSAVFLGAVGTFFAEPFIALLYGPPYHEAAMAFRVLIWLIPLTLLSGHYRYALIAYNRQRLEFLSAACGAGLNVIPAHGDFRLGRQATGQTADSPAINRGSDTAENLGLGGRTAFTDKYPDLGQVDLGYHETLLRPSQGTLTLDGATLTLGLSSDGFTLSGNLRPGDASDGMEPGVEYVEVEFGGFLFFFPAGDSQVTLDKLADGSVDLTVTGTADFGQFLVPTLGASFRLGDDFASAVVRLGGTLQFP